jgi:hypothetical protein
MAGDLFLQVGNRRVSVNPYRITGSHTKQLNDKIGEARAKANAPKDLAPEKGETKEDYDKRRSEWLKTQNENHDKRTVDEILKENNTLDLASSLGFMYDCVNAIAETFQTRPIDSLDELDNEPLYEVNNFIVRVCRLARVPIELDIIKLEE